MSRSFNGTTNKIEYGTGLNISGAAISIYGYAKRLDATKETIVLSRRELPGTFHYQFMWRRSSEGNVLRFEFNDGASFRAAESGAVTGTVFKHLAVTHDGTNTRFYVDGALESTVSNAFSLGSFAGLTARTGFDGGSSFSNAVFAQIGVHTAVLSLGEIKEAFRRGWTYRSRAAIWPLWGVASPEPDLSGSGNNGTVTGATKADHAPVGRYAHKPIWIVRGPSVDGLNGSIIFNTTTLTYQVNINGVWHDLVTTPISGSKFIEYLEIGDPAAPDSDRARLYVKDNGAGKTQLVVRFSTGAVQVIATEP